MVHQEKLTVNKPNVMQIKVQMMNWLHTAFNEIPFVL